jgi:phosphate transport system ATP-binding protein
MTKGTDDVPTMTKPSLRVQTARTPLPQREQLERIFTVENVSALYGGSHALKDVSLEIHKNLITAVIGPSGCGKSTFVRCLNRMNDVVPGFSMTGTIRYHGQDVTAADVDPVAVRRNIGMVFQRPNPFPKSIYDNIAWGLRVLGMRDGLDERVERALIQAALWDEVKDRLKAPAVSLSGGQQQRLCIARALAIRPDVLLMDEPASALDPIATQRIEELIYDLKKTYTVVIVTHNMQQAARVSVYTALFWLGRLVEHERTDRIFTAPREKLTEDYVTGRFG